MELHPCPEVVNGQVILAILLSATQQHDAWQETEQALCQFETDGVFEGPCELLIVVGTKEDS